MDSEARRHAPLEMDSATFRKLGHRLVDQVAGLLESMPQGPVNHDESPSSVRDALNLNGSLPESGMEPEQLLEQTAKLLFEHSLFNGHPRFFGYITSSPAPIGILGDFLASALNPNVGAWILSPAATEIERQTVRWIASLIGYSRTTAAACLSAAATWRIWSAFWRRARRKRVGMYANWESPRMADAGFGCTRRPKRTPGFIRRRTAVALERAIDPVDDDLRMDVAAAPADRIRHRRRRCAMPRRRDGRIRQHGRGRSAARNCGICREYGLVPCRWRVRRVCGMRSRCVDGSSRDHCSGFRRRGSAQMVVCTARSRVRTRPRSGTAPRGVRLPSAVLPLRGECDELCRLRTSELARFSRTESVARAEAGGSSRLSQNDCRRYPLVENDGPGDGTSSGFQLMTQELSIATFRYVPLDLRTHSGHLNRTLSRCAQPGIARPAAAQRRDLCFQRRHRRPLRSARMHRELSYVSGCLGGPGHRRANRTRRGCEAAPGRIPERL